MSEERALLAETLERLLRDTPASALWQRLDALGLPLLLVPEVEGGAGGCFEDAFVVQIFCPSSRQPPATRVARVRTFARSEPASGSL